MLLLVFWWYIQLPIPVLKQQLPPLKNGYIALGFPDLLYTIEAPLSSTLTLSIGQKILELPYDREQLSPWTNGKIETQNQHIARYWRNFLNDAGTNCSSLAPKFAFAHNTSVNYTTGKSHYEIVFGTKPQVPMSLKPGLYRNNYKLCCSEFCKDLP